MSIFAAVKSIVKILLQDEQTRLVEFEGRTLYLHDCYHIQVSRMPAIKIAGHQVTGIDGVRVEVFGNSEGPSKYDPMLDEVRVGFHTWIVSWQRPYSWVILGNYMVWCVCKGINPIQVIKDHLNSMNH